METDAPVVEKPSHTALYWTGIAMDAIAMLMPSIGRDFTLEVSPGPMQGGSINLQIGLKALTPLGQEFIKHVQPRLMQTMQQLAKDRG